VFAAQTGMAWAGGLALGAGGAMGGEPLPAAKRSAPPVRHVIEVCHYSTCAPSTPGIEYWLVGQAQALARAGRISSVGVRVLFTQIAPRGEPQPKSAASDE